MLVLSFARRNWPSASLATTKLLTYFVPDEFNPSVLIEAKITGLYPDSLQ